MPDGSIRANVITSLGDNPGKRNQSAAHGFTQNEMVLKLPVTCFARAMAVSIASEPPGQKRDLHRLPGVMSARVLARRTAVRLV